MLDARERVGVCDGVRLVDGVRAGVGKAVRVGLPDKDSEHVADADAVVDAVNAEDEDDVAVIDPVSDNDDVDAGVGADERVSLVLGVCVEASVGKAVRVALALGVRDPMNDGEADGAAVGNAVRVGVVVAEMWHVPDRDAVGVLDPDRAALEYARLGVTDDVASNDAVVDRDAVAERGLGITLREGELSTKDPIELRA